MSKDGNPIARYKKRHKLTYPQLATLLGITPDYARKLGCGMQRRVRPTLAKQIEERSNGEIAAHELVFVD